MKQVGYIKSTNNHAPNLDAIFSALAHPARREILTRLSSGEVPVQELSEPFNMSQPAISKHLKVLEKAGLIERKVDEQRRPAILNANNLAVAVDWLEHFRKFWSSNFDQLDLLLEDMKQDRKKDG